VTAGRAKLGTEGTSRSSRIAVEVTEWRTGHMVEYRATSAEEAAHWRDEGWTLVYTVAWAAQI
jgi:hypothetical protein